MDLIGTLASQLNIDSGKAEGLAGSVLGSIQGAIGEKYGADSAAELGSSVPELDGWKQKAAGLLGGGGEAESGGGLGDMLSGLAGGGGGGAADLLGAAAGALGGGGGGGMTGLVAILGKLDLDSDKIGLIAKLVMSFLQNRTEGGLLDKVKAVAPMLTGGGEGEGDLAGGLGKALGGLF